MNKSFYQYVLKFRAGEKDDEFSQFAQEIYRDHSFPKYSSEYHEISSYLEYNDSTLINAVVIFDKIWEMYEQEILNR